MKPYTFCSFCGARYPENAGWPRKCPECGNTAYRNPLPVAVVLVPVEAGLLLMRRLVEPHVGKLALPGGYINYGESWQAAGAREVMEETGISLDAAKIREFGVRSAPDGSVLIFGVSDPAERAAVTVFQPTDEATECVVIDSPNDAELAFPLHAEAVAAYFAEGGHTSGAPRSRV